MRPFSSGYTYSNFRDHLERIKTEINSLDNEYILKASRVELEEYYCDKEMIKEVNIEVDNKYLDNKRAIKITMHDYFERNKTFQVPGTAYDLCIPFSGDELLFRLSPSTLSLSGYPDIEIYENILIIPIKYQDSNADGEKIKKEMESDLNSIVNAISYVNADVKKHNVSVADTISRTIDSKIDKAKKALDAISFLDIPIKRKNQPETYVVNVNRKVNKTAIRSKPKVTAGKYEPEPTLSDDEYNHILEVMRSMSKVIERSPKSFMDMYEEDIRMHFLLQLNGHYEGQASGETFNKSGKTDILIREGDKNIFIGECKFWKGPKAFNDAIDQLLSYLAWRDSKCALLIFNKNKNSSDVAEKMHSIMIERSECKKVIQYSPEGDSKYIFIKNSDPGKEIIITTQLYDLPNC